MLMRPPQVPPPTPPRAFRGAPHNVASDMMPHHQTLILPSLSSGLEEGGRGEQSSRWARLTIRCGGALHKFFAHMAVGDDLRWSDMSHHQTFLGTCEDASAKEAMCPRP